MIFQITGVIVLLIFYGIYIGKMITQRRKGIQTDQMGKGEKSGRLFWTEIIMKTATYLTVVIEAVSILWNVSFFPLWLRCAGIIIAFLGVLLFASAVFTMRDSWRAGIPEKDKTEMVISGIYSISRNPAFLGFDLTYAGLLLMFFNPVLLAASCWAAVMLHLQIVQEEAFLAEVFGNEYAAYKKHVGRYFGRRRIRKP